MIDNLSYYVFDAHDKNKIRVIKKNIFLDNNKKC